MVTPSRFMPAASQSAQSQALARKEFQPTNAERHHLGWPISALLALRFFPRLVFINIDSPNLTTFTRSSRIKVSRFVSSQTLRVERHQDSPDHAHSLKESDQLKRPQAIRNLIEAEAIKNYRPPAIVQVVKESAIDQLGLAEAVHALRRKEVSNIQAKFRGPMMAHLLGNASWAADVEESTQYLLQQGYRIERFSVSRRATEGIVFAHPAQLEKLRHYGYLTLIDSTHKSNRHDWRLFTLYVRDNFGCWDVGAHFFVSGEDGDTVGMALKIVRQFERQWNPRYILADQSNVEAKSISVVFPGLRGGEQECDLLLCTVHVMRTWLSRIYHLGTREKMLLAMHKRTRIGCEDVIQQAISQCPVPSIQQYIIRNYQTNTQ